jgi:hypothetical protein
MSVESDLYGQISVTSFSGEQTLEKSDQTKVKCESYVNKEGECNFSKYAFVEDGKSFGSLTTTMNAERGIFYLEAIDCNNRNVPKGWIPRKIGSKSLYVQ